MAAGTAGRAAILFCSSPLGGRPIGRTPDSDSGYPGSSPGLPANLLASNIYKSYSRKIPVPYLNEFLNDPARICSERVDCVAFIHSSWRLDEKRNLTTVVCDRHDQDGCGCLVSAFERRAGEGGRER